MKVRRHGEVTERAGARHGTWDGIRERSTYDYGTRTVVGGGAGVAARAARAFWESLRVLVGMLGTAICVVRRLTKSLLPLTKRHRIEAAD